MLVKKEKNVEIAAAKCGISDKTARKYLKHQKPPSELKQAHTWRTREEVFEDEIWQEAIGFLENNPGLEAKYLFKHLQEKYSDKFQDGQLRTFQRKVQVWKITDGPSKEVVFAQKHHPGELCSIDYTHMDSLGITIGGELFKHLLFHFVLTYSNWEAGTICYSESLESLIEGLQNALWELGGVPKFIRSDNLTAAVYKSLNKKVFTERYKLALQHYGLEGKTINAGKANENGDVEQSHYRLKKAVEQELILRGSRNFDSLEEYEKFLKKLFFQLNSGRIKRLQEELLHLHKLPANKLDNFKELSLKVGPSSTISVSHNTYSVDSRLIGMRIKVLLTADSLIIYYGSKKMDEFQRLRGSGKHKIDYRHIISSLKKKPGAFENYRYRDELFPTINFRLAYDYFKKHNMSQASKLYIKLLLLATEEGENLIDQSLNLLFAQEQKITLDNIQANIKTLTPTEIPEVTINEIDINAYDELIENPEALYV